MGAEAMSREYSPIFRELRWLPTSKMFRYLSVPRGGGKEKRYRDICVYVYALYMLPELGFIRFLEKYVEGCRHTPQRDILARRTGAAKLPSSTQFHVFFDTIEHTGHFGYRLPKQAICGRFYARWSVLVFHW